MIPARIPVDGVGIDPVTERDVIDHITSSAAAGVGGWMLTPNVDLLRQSRDPEVSGFFGEADLVVADGMPVLWAAQLAGTPLPGRVAGSDLIWTLSEAARDSGLTVFLLGGNPGTADRAAEKLVEAYPGLSIVGTDCPPFGYERDPDALRAIDEAVGRAQPDIVFVGLPFPKQAHLARRLRGVVPSAWMLCVGVVFSFVVGDIPRAPVWMQRIGLEWVWRLAHEPRRLFKRYIVQGLPFALRLFRWAMRTRRFAASKAPVGR